MKKIICILLSLTMLFAIFGCNDFSAEEVAVTKRVTDFLQAVKQRDTAKAEELCQSAEAGRRIFDFDPKGVAEQKKKNMYVAACDTLEYTVGEVSLTDEGTAAAEVTLSYVSIADIFKKDLSLFSALDKADTYEKVITQIKGATTKKEKTFDCLLTKTDGVWMVDEASANKVYGIFKITIY